MDTGESLDVDEQEVNWIRDRWFDSLHGQLKSDDPIWDEYQRRFSALEKSLDGLPDLRQGEVKAFIADTLSSAEFRRGMDYLKQTAPSDLMLRLFREVDEAWRSNRTYTIPDPWIIWAKNSLRNGGFEWKFRYFENCTSGVLTSAAIQYAKEHGFASDWQ